MRQQSFYDWLIREAASSRMALISLYETRDRLLYIEAPELRKKYLGIFGDVENAVLQSELETALLSKKVELIQAAINRREEIDIDKIDEIIESEKEERLTELEQNDVTLNELPQLTEKQKQTLQILYHDITSGYHPVVNSNLTDTQKELYQKAKNAYKMQDVDAMQIIHDCLFEKDYKETQGQLTAESNQAERNDRTDFHSIASYLTTDYSLAKDLYRYFIPLEDDIIISNAIRDCEVKRKEVEGEIAKIRSGFPFNAVDTMNDKVKTEEYKAELRIRARKSESEKEELLEKIKKLTEGRVNG